MLADARLDGVIVSVGPQVHSKVAIDAMGAGLHVFLEKPPAMCTADVEEVARTSRMTGRVCMTGFRKRFMPALQRAKVIIGSPEFGEQVLLSVVATSGRFTNLPDKPTTWFLLDYGIHVLDLVRFLFGEVADVAAWSAGSHAYSIHLRFVSGAVGCVAMTSRRSWAASGERVQATGEQGHFLDVDDGVRLRHYSPNGLLESTEPNFSSSRIDSLTELGFVGELTEFVTAIREARAPLSDMDNACRTMMLYDEIARAVAATS
jgi:predicted dehydrogenase